MKLDRLTLLLLIAVEAAKLVPRTLAADGLTLLLWARIYTTFHPRRLALTFGAHAARKALRRAAAPSPMVSENRIQPVLIAS